MSEVHQNKETDQSEKDRHLDANQGKWVDVFDKGDSKEKEEKESKSPWLDIPIEKKDKGSDKIGSNPWLNVFKKGENAVAKNDAGESKNDTNTETNKTDDKGLTSEQKEKIKKETGWSDEIIDAIGSWEEYEIYKNAGLHEEIVDGRPCLVKDIDMDYVDPKTGLTNRELMAKGRSPIDSRTGEKIELHHMGQDPNGPFAELCENSEHGDGNHGILHDNDKESWRNDKTLLNQYNNHDKPNHWIARAKEA